MRSSAVAEPALDGCRLFDLVVDFGWTGSWLIVVCPTWLLLDILSDRSVVRCSFSRFGIGRSCGFREKSLTSSLAGCSGLCAFSELGTAFGFGCCSGIDEITAFNRLSNLDDGLVLGVISSKYDADASAGIDGSSEIEDTLWLDEYPELRDCIVLKRRDSAGRGTCPQSCQILGTKGSGS